MDGYDIKLCGKYDIARTMVFFGANWDARHNLAVSREYVERFFFDSCKDNYNILIAKQPDGEIAGLLAYVTNKYYDWSICAEDKFVWATHWLCKANGIGLKLLTSLFRHENTKNIGTVGNNEQAGAIYGALGFKNGKLKHYFLPNERIMEFRLLNRANSIYIEEPCLAEPYFPGVRQYDLVEIAPNKNTESMPTTGFPVKTYAYYVNKYLYGEYYKYHMMGVLENAEIKAGFIFKAVSREFDAETETPRLSSALSDSANALTIVEYFGDESCLCGLRCAFQELLRVYNAEYINFYCYGLKDEYLRSAGFRQDDETVAPEYFEPFVRQNIEINFAYNTVACGESSVRIFKGDGDREHPRRQV